MSRDAPRPRAAQWRAPRPPRRPIARWFGIASCLVVVGLLTATVLTQPIGSEIGRLIGPWLEWRHAPERATPPADPAPPAVPERARSLDQPQSGSMPGLTRQDIGVAGPPLTAVPMAGAAVSAPDRPAAFLLPRPSFKPPASAQ
jgi:hypothetical protein